MKATLVDEAGVLLLKHGFTVKTLSRGCFDLVARKEDAILLVKALEDANSISSEYAEAMLKISGYIGASPTIVAKKAGSPLEDGVVYLRFGVYTLSCGTLGSTLDNKLPFLLSSKAGLTAAVVGGLLKKKREESGYSLGEVSRKVGVSKRMITRYESGGADISVNRAYSLQKLFGRNIFRKIDLFGRAKAVPASRKSEFAEKYTKLGFEADDAKKVPFDVIARKDREIIFTEIGEKTNPQLLPLQKLIEADTLVIFKKKKPKGIPALTKKEFLGYDSAKELIKFLKEFE